LHDDSDIGGGLEMSPARAKKTPQPQRSNDEIRRLILEYFYDRNRSATSVMGKKGSAVKISDVKSELKEQHGLTQQEVQSNLTYLISQGWVEEKPVEKEVRARGGTVIPSVTRFYQITAAGIDKIEGPGEFTRDRFQGIRIDATGQNIITLGDGNQVNVRFRDAGEALVKLRQAVKESPQLDETAKMNLVADIDSMQDQLAKPEPNKAVVRTLWTTIKGAATVAGLVEAVANLTPHVHALLK
jgi:predicted transcriptional regulator